MTKTDMINRLEERAEKLEDAREDCLQREVNRDDAAEKLKYAETFLLMEEPTRLTGRNAEARAAQLGDFTARERKNLREADLCLSAARCAVAVAQDRFSAAKYSARVFAAEDTEV